MPVDKKALPKSDKVVASKKEKDEKPKVIKAAKSVSDLIGKGYSQADVAVTIVALTGTRKRPF